ncbi:SAM-dependent methyltransferase [Rhodothermus profundi]|uniref:Methyltransferase domain-containing protein n=1 Tax=Rhodothermus profundi TaxID=633813 RepID=A0A1M6RMV2_9BACT|nr:class I SAM-dependent methyltransferase [Rhodothermus profundi]SHK33766.1 Methyltransferase domain-containing protein [Rhodothermus profundi]
MHPERWNQRFASPDFFYGTAPNAFIAETIPRYLRPGAEVIELGAGEGRNAVWLARQGFCVTALDYAEIGLEKTRQLATQAGVTVDTVQADVTRWQPDRTWDAVVITFLHLPPEARPILYALVHRILRPKGYLIAEWFRPEQRIEGYPSGGPPDPTWMVTADELRQHFAPEGFHLLENATPVLHEGPGHQGPAATVRLVWQQRMD